MNPTHTYPKYIFFLFTAFLYLFPSSLLSQFHQSSFIQTEVYPGSGKAGISIQSNTFFHNYEFFHPLEKGYTLTGTWLQPELRYSFNDKFTVSAGVHLLKYHGIEVFTRELPVFSFIYRPGERISICLGNFAGGEHHRMSEVLFSPGRQFSNFPEGGMSMRYAGESLESEFWIDWERMIFHGDPFNEEVTAGTSTLFQPGKKDAEQRFSIPLQIIAKHRGGQINTGSRSVDTWWNMLTGIETLRKYEGNFFRELSFKIHIPFYYYEGATGYGIFPQIETEIPGSKISLGYFRADNFKTIHGIGLYDSYKYMALTNNYVEGGISEAISLRTGFSIPIHEQVKLVSRFDAWYDTRREKIDYLSGLYVVVRFDKEL